MTLHWKKVCVNLLRFTRSVILYKIPISCPAVASFFETCDWNTSRVNNNGYQRGGNRIKVQVAATSRCKKESTHELKKIPQGRPKKDKENNTYETEQQEEPSRFIMPA
ncbi:hypothetical protein C2G38_2048536 [Gigaspora rosea]|uniref:Uncharacterized protein n=1 Tax=Gigaspora rosea TaxID=44941 RepID=A0A397U5A5_9GLOM|nr:hypothetical protein C2G38_2048536 [Gigaspora rosea]